MGVILKSREENLDTSMSVANSRGEVYSLEISSSGICSKGCQWQVSAIQPLFYTIKSFLGSRFPNFQ